MLSKISVETFDGGETFDDFGSALENALSMTRLAARSNHEGVGAVNTWDCSLSLTLEQVTQQEMSKETRQAERRDSRKKNPRADAEWWPRSSCGTVSGKRQVLGVSQKSAQGHQLVRKPTEGLFEKDRQAAEKKGCATVHWRT